MEMKKWVCEIHAISNVTGQLETFTSDEFIHAPTLEIAIEFAEEQCQWLHPVCEYIEDYTEEESEDDEVEFDYFDLEEKIKPTDWDLTHLVNQN